MIQSVQSQATAPARDPQNLDFAIAGAGFAGCVAAVGLRASGFTVLLVEPHAAFPEAFRAEKLEPDQTAGLRSFGLLDELEDIRTAVDNVVAYRSAGVRHTDYEGQFGIRYHDLVNTLRARALGTLPVVSGSLQSLEQADGHVVLSLQDGSTVRARNCVLATGGATILRRCHQPFAEDADLSTLTFGFDTVAAKIGDTPPAAFNQHSTHPHRTGLLYATFFPIGKVLRANVFTHWLPGDERIPKMMAQPMEVLRELLPELDRSEAQRLRCCSKVQVASTRFHRVTAPGPDGVIAVGETFQSVSPATGMGLSKCLTDAATLVRHTQRWPKGVPATAAAIRAFYDDREKAQVDREAESCWRWFHGTVHGRSLKWWLRRGPVGRVLEWWSLRGQTEAGQGSGGAAT